LNTGGCESFASSGGDTTINVLDSGTLVGEFSALNLANNLTVTDNGDTATVDASGGSTSSDTDFSFSTAHTSWSNGLTDEEIFRTQMEPGESLRVDRIEFRGKGGASDTASVDVYDDSDNAEIGSADRGQTTISPGSTSNGATVLIRLENETGSEIFGSVYVQGVIE
jgi:hypothetical protein